MGFTLSCWILEPEQCTLSMPDSEKPSLLPSPPTVLQNGYDQIKGRLSYLVDGGNHCPGSATCFQIKQGFCKSFTLCFLKSIHNIDLIVKIIRQQFVSSTVLLMIT